MSVKVTLVTSNMSSLFSFTSIDCRYRTPTFTRELATANVPLMCHVISATSQLISVKTVTFDNTAGFFFTQ